MASRVILEAKEFKIIIDRLCYELIENHGDFQNAAIIGIQPRGVLLSDRIVKRLKELTGLDKIDYGVIDPTFYRDDFRRRDKPLIANDTRIEFSIEGVEVILIDDVFFTGRTVRSAIDALVDLGRPDKVELLTLIHRRYSKHLPLFPDYIGRTIDSISSEMVRVEYEDIDGSDKIWILEEE